MSRIGNKPVIVPTGVTLSLDARRVTVKGPKGELSLTLHPVVTLTQEGSDYRVTVRNPEVKKERALWGLTVRLLQNMVTGVTQGFAKKLEINGVGYRVALEGTTLNFSLGFSHPVKVALPQGISAIVEKNTLTLSGIDKQQVGEICAQIRKLRPPEPYKGKGIKYEHEVIRRKAGKQVKAAGAGAK